MAEKKLQVNQAAVTHAQRLIQEGKVDRGERNWTETQPTAAMGDEYLADHSWNQYGEWFLGINPDANPDTKERYEFPIGNFRTIFRSGVIAAKARAGQYKHDDIEKAAGMILDLINQG